MTSDGGLLLWSDLERSLGVTRKLASCFRDQRHQDWVEHSVEELLAQRILGLASGYEDLNDHNRLRVDPLLAGAAGKTDPLGMNRTQPDQQGKALAGAATLNRLELTNNKTDSRDHKIVADHEAIAELLLGLGVGTLENNIKEEQLGLFGERLSTHWLASNQLRLWFSALARYMMERLRTIGLRGTALAGATAETIRTRLLKIGGVVTVSVRRVYVQLASSLPLQELFQEVWRRLQRLPAASG